MVLGQLSVPGRLTDLDFSWARTYRACSMCGLGIVWAVFSCLAFLSSFSLSRRRSDIID